MAEKVCFKVFFLGLSSKDRQKWDKKNRGGNTAGGSANI